MRFFSHSASLALLSTAASFASAATVCNGYAELCSKPYSSVSIIGAHNSYTASSSNLAANQDYDVTQQLKDGVRLLQNQVHFSNNALRLCHTSCFLYDGGLLTTYLQKVKTWMDANPNDVVTILLVNIDNRVATEFDAIYKQAGLNTLSYVPPQAAVPATAWPTYGKMIDAGTRLVTFMDNTASFATVPYIIDEFSNLWETKFDVMDQAFPCAIDRFTGDTAGQMFLINHFLYTTSDILGGSTPVPNKALLNVTNAATGFGSLGQEADTCMALHKRYPTFLLVDFYNYGEGSVFEVAARLNGVTYTKKPIAPPNPQTATATGTSGSATRTSNAATAVLLVDGSTLGSLAVMVFGAVLGSWVAM